MISAAWDAANGRLDGAVLVESEVGGLCTLQLPPSQVEDTLVVRTSRVGGHAVPATHVDGRWTFETVAGETYSVSTQPVGATVPAPHV